MDKNSFFWLGGFTSFAAYGIVAAIIIFAINDTINVKKIAIKSEQSAIEVSIEEPTQSISEPVPQEEVVPEVEKKPIDAKKPKEKVIEEPKETKKTIKELFKKTEQKEVKKTPLPQEQPKSAKDLLASLSIKKNSDVSFVSFNSSGEVNEYLSSIAKIIKQNWAPYKADAGLIATVVVNIEADGSFSFRIKRGANADFNERLTSCLKSLQTKGFSAPVDKKAVSVEFNFKARE
jgi:outer membrane biosynthesis protein TonB